MCPSMASRSATSKLRPPTKHWLSERCAKAGLLTLYGNCKEGLGVVNVCATEHGRKPIVIAISAVIITQYFLEFCIIGHCRSNVQCCANLRRKDNSVREMKPQYCAATSLPEAFDYQSTERRYRYNYQSEALMSPQ